jgi:hypothetical protein
MKLKGIITTAALLQATLVGAAAPSAAQAAEVGAGWTDAAVCMGCVGGGIVLMMSGGGGAVAAAVIVGGPQAVAAASAVAACIYACVNAFEE